MTDEASRVAALVDRLPPTIRVGLFDIRIEKWSQHQARAAARWGEFSPIEQRISVQAEMPTATKLADTLVHEIMHAIWWASDLEKTEGEEHVVCHMGTGWCLVLRDNPWLGDWLRAALTPCPPLPPPADVTGHWTHKGAGGHDRLV